MEDTRALALIHHFTEPEGSPGVGRHSDSAVDTDLCVESATSSRPASGPRNGSQGRIHIKDSMLQTCGKLLSSQMVPRSACAVS